MGNFFGKLGNFICAEVGGLGKPANVSFWSVVGEALWGCLVALLDGIMFLIYVIMKFVLNIVDFLQFFVKKLMGLDYWGKGTASLENLDESDVIFRFLKDENVMQVFKYMIGIFIVLLIVFTIIAIIKTEWAYASSSADSNSKGSILNRSLKACMLVVLLPILIIMGILASNAILTSLVNAFNINNNLTMGGQVFTASAYDANKYRQYAKNNIRLGVTSNVSVTAMNKDGDSETILVPASLTAIVPMKYKSDSKFTGICFMYEGTEYLYYVEQNELDNHYRHYVTYIRDILDATIITASQLGVNTAVSGEDETISVALHPLDGDHRLVQAAYNTWGYNELFTRDTLTFDKTVDPTEYAFYSDTGHTFADARLYKNNNNWAKFYDGGASGLVTIPDEYYVMADVIDFMISQGAEMSFVNIANPLINWTYVGTGTYLNGKFVQGITTHGYPREFMVNYADSGYTVYTPNREASSEEKGAIYIMAYYNSTTSRYIPVVNNKTYVDDQGNKHTFKSSSLDTNYEGLIVARGVLDSTFKNRVGQPTQITTDYSDSTGNYVGIDTPYYMQVNANPVTAWAESGTTITAGLSNSFAGLTITNGNYEGILNDGVAGGLDSLLGVGSIDTATYKDKLDKLAESLPTKLTFVSLTEGGATATTMYNDMEWFYDSSSPLISITSADGTSTSSYLVFIADQLVNVHVDNKVLSGGSGGNRYNTTYVMRDVPLFCLVSLDATKATAIFAYGQNNVTSLLNEASGLVQRGDGIYGNWSSRSDTLLARAVTLGNVAFIAPDANEELNNGTYTDTEVPLSVVARIGTEFGYLEEMETLSGLGSALSNSASITQIDSLINVDFTKADTTTESKTLAFSFSKLTREMLVVPPEITGDILDGSVSAGGHSGTGKFVEHAGTRVEGNSYTDYFFGWQQGGVSTLGEVRINVRVRIFNDGRVTMMVYDTYSLNVTDYYGAGNNTLKVGNKVLYISAYDMEYAGYSGGLYTYRYEATSNQYFYFKFRETGGRLEPVAKTEASVQNMYQIVVAYYNLFSYRIGDETKQFDPTTNTTAAATPLKKESYYLRPTSIEFGTSINESTDGALKIYEGTLYKEDNAESYTKKGSVITSFNLSFDKTKKPSDYIEDAIKEINSISGTSGKFSRIPDLGSDSLATELFTERQQHIQFFRHSFSKGVVRFDFSFNPLSLFGEGSVWRFKLAFLSGVSNVEEKTLKFTITNGRLYLDYNFASVKHLTLNTFFMPSKMNVVVLVFASILLFSVLGQAVWGLVARIYDIVLYFIIMPAVVSTTVIQSDSKIYNNWQSSLISKVMGSYGVLIGINFFFLLIPAIKEASQLFTDHDLATNISQGSWVSLLSADAVNNLVYILFLLVAFTIIKTLPGTIGNLIGLKKGDEAYGAGAAVKKSVDSVISDVSHHVSGASLLEAKGNAGQMIKNFTPGSAIYDDWKKKHPKKSSEERSAEEAQRGAEIARQEAQRQQELAQQQMEAGRGQRTPGQQAQANVDEINPNAVTEAMQDNQNIVENAVDNAVDGGNVDVDNIDPNAVQEATNEVTEEANQSAENAVENATENAAENAVQNAIQGDGGAAAYAASAAASAAAAQAYADIASGNTAGYAQRADAQAAAEKEAQKQAARDEKEAARAEKQAEKEAIDAEMEKHPGASRRDIRKLMALEQELKDAESDTKIAQWRKEESFENFNAKKNTALEDQVLETATYYNSNLNKEIMKKAEEENISESKARKEVMEELAVKHWNKTHQDQQITAEELKNNNTLKREVNNEFKDHQAKLQATAKNEFITDKIQERINKQQTKIELKDKGLYQNTLQKALSKNPIFHRSTDVDRIRLDEKRTDAKEELAKLEKTRENMVRTGKGYAEKNKELDKLIKVEEKKLAEAQELKAKQEQMIRDGKGGKNAKKTKDKAIQDINKAQNHLDALRGERAHNEEKMMAKAKQLVDQDAKIASTKNKIAKIEQALDGNYQGLLAGLARRTANGGRFVKAGTHLAAQRMAEGLANRAEKKFDKQESKKVKSDHSSNDNEKFTEGQIKSLDRRKESVDASAAALKNYATKHGLDASKFGDKESAKQALQAHMNKELSKNAHSEAGVIRAQYEEMQKEVDKLFAQKDKAERIYQDTKREFNRKNHNSYVRRDTKLGKKQVNAAEKAKSRLINEMNEKNRKGLMTSAEEQDYISKILSYDEAIADAKDKRMSYHKVRRQITDTEAGRKFVAARGKVNEGLTVVKGWASKGASIARTVGGGIATGVKAVGHAGKVTGQAIGEAGRFVKNGVVFVSKATGSFVKERALDVKDATYGRYKRAKSTKAYMSSAEHAAQRNSYIKQNREALRVERAKAVKELEDIRKRGQSILQGQLDKKYVNRVKSDLAKSGGAGQIAGIKSRQDAERLVTQLQRTLGNSNKFASMQMAPKTQQRGLEEAVMKAFNNNFNKLAKAAGRQELMGSSRNLQNALTRSTQFHNALKAVENKLKKELRQATKVDTAKGVADELAKVQSQLKTLKNIEDRTKRQVARLNSTMKKMERDKKSEKYKIKGLDKSSDATKK